MIRYLKTHLFETATIIILLVAVFLRFYNYENRFVLASDQAMNAIIGRYALNEFKLPLLGPFSSAGPFQTGGEWFWIVMAGTLLYPRSSLAPSVFLTLISVLFVYLMIRFSIELSLAKKTRDARIFGFIIGTVAAFSGGQVLQSYNLTNQTPIALLSLLTIWFAIRYLRQKRSLYIFLATFCTALAMAIHLQGVLLGIIILVTLVFSKLRKKKDILYVLLGGVLPFLPILISDFQHNFFNFKNMYHYYTVDQYNITYDMLGRRWLTYLTVFWPTSWAYVIGGVKELGYGIIAGVSIITGLKLLRRNFNREWLVLLTSFIIMIVMLRYIHTPIFENYIVFLHPFIVLFSGLFLYTVYRFNRFLGIIAILIVVAGSVYKLIPEMRQTNYNDDLARKWQALLYQKYPDQQFVLYDYKLDSTNRSYPLVLHLYTDGRISDDGMRIGVIHATAGATIKQEVLDRVITDNDLVNLESSTAAELDKEKWFPINPSFLYKSMQAWQTD